MPKKQKIDEEVVIDENIQNVEMEGRNLEEKDFGGIRQLLQQLFLKEQLNLSQFCEILIAQAGIGSVLKNAYFEEEDDDDDDDFDDMIFAVSSVLNLYTNKDTDIAKQLFALMQRLLNSVPTQVEKDKLQIILSGNYKCGLLLNERAVNLSADSYALPLLTSLQSELIKMKKRDNAYDFDYFVLISKTYKLTDGTEVFVNEEEEIFAQEAEVNIEYNVTSQWSGSMKKNCTPFRKIIFIQSNKLDSIINKIKVFVSS